MSVSSRIRVVLCLAMATVAIGSFGGIARAGTYDVYACDPNRAGGATTSWDGFNDTGLTAYSNCGGGSAEGIVTRSVAGPGATSSAFQGAYAAFDAPDGTTIESIHASFYLGRLGCNWAAGLKATSGDLTGRFVYALQPGHCGTDRIDWTYFDWPINDRRAVLMVACGASSCDRNGETRAAMRNVRVTVSDTAAPSLSSPRGPLWATDGWLAGSQDVGFDASDGSGIRANRVLVDGQQVLFFDHGCADTLRAPCPNGGMSGTLDTRKITPDGTHELRLETTDTAGNPSAVAKTIRVDNTPPASPTGVAVVNGDGWRSSNGFDVSWSNPASDGVAPITTANYRLCPSTGDGCVTGSRTADSITSMASLQVPSPGDWTLAVWLGDAAGNASADTVAAPVHLRFDDVAPSVAFEAPNPSDPTLVSARASDVTSSVVEGRIEIRRHGSDLWKALPSSYDRSHITARLDDEHLDSGSYDLRAWAKDAAGNERTGTELADGGSAEVRLPLRVLTKINAASASRHGHRHHTRWRAHVRIGFGKRTRLAGQLLTADGNPIAASEVLVYSRERRAGAPWLPAASVKTTRRGYFSYRVPVGPSRSIKFRFGGTATIRPTVRRVVVAVPANATIRAAPRHLLNGEYVHLKGILKGGTVPPGGKLVEVQALVRGHWRTFATRRTDDSGRWRFQYRFDGTQGRQTYHLRLRIPAEANYPYASGRSKGITVTVRGL